MSFQSHKDYILPYILYGWSLVIKLHCGENHWQIHVAAIELELWLLETGARKLEKKIGPIFEVDDSCYSHFSSLTAPTRNKHFIRRQQTIYYKSFKTPVGHCHKQNFLLNINRENVAFLAENWWKVPVRSTCIFPNPVVLRTASSVAVHTVFLH